MPDTAQEPPQRADRARDLNAALLSTFAPNVLTPPFPDRVAELCRALTNARQVSVWMLDDGGGSHQLLAASGPAPETAQVAPALDDTAEMNAPALHATATDFVATLALPTGEIARLVVSRPSGGAAAQGLAYERVTMLSHLSFAQFRNPDQQAQANLVKTVHAVAAGQEDALQSLADVLARMTGSDYAAAGLVRDGRVAQLKVSGQDGFTKRADLPVRVRQDLTDIANQRLQSSERAFGQAATRSNGLAMLLHRPQRGPAVLPLAAALFNQAPHHAQPRRWTMKRALRIAAVMLVIAGVGFVPIPDGTSVPAHVEAVEKRLLTAPFTSVVQSVDVADGARVSAGQVVVTLDTRDLDLELIGVQSDRAAALIEQETARLSGNAASLRNAEVSVERLDARIALLTAQKEAARVRTPISGVADLTDLKQRVGTTVRQGDALLEVADPSRLQLALSIPERQIGKLSTGDEGLFRPDFNPTLKMGSRVTVISPAIDLTAQIPVALGWAEITGPPTGLRPGVQGVFVVDGTYTPLWQVVYRTLRDWMLLRFWF